MLKRPLAGISALVLLLGLAACGDDSDDASAKDDGGSGEGVECAYSPDGSEASVDVPPTKASETGDVAVTIETSVGDLKATLDGAAAPCTVNSFLSLADQGYFDGTSCHRMTTSPGFGVLQCGDPTGTGSGGPGYAFDDELTGKETYSAGTLAMANAGPNTNGSQFFIVYTDTGLDPAYTVFGTVDEAAIKTVEGVAADGVTPVMGPEDGTPKTPVEISGVTED